MEADALVIDCRQLNLGTCGVNAPDRPVRLDRWPYPEGSLLSR